MKMLIDWIIGAVGGTALVIAIMGVFQPTLRDPIQGYLIWCTIAFFFGVFIFNQLRGDPKGQIPITNDMTPEEKEQELKYRKDSRGRGRLMVIVLLLFMVFVAFRSLGPGGHIYTDAETNRYSSQLEGKGHDWAQAIIDLLEGN